jgi:hypothetical protein
MNYQAISENPFLLGVGGNQLQLMYLIGLDAPFLK